MTSKLVQAQASQAELKDEESAADYNSGGYLAVKVNDTFKDGRYVVLRKLGWGHFSTVWLIRDTRSLRHSALKVVKSAGRYAETARDEIRLLQKVSAANPIHPGHPHVVSFLDSFHHCGPEDTHICIVLEPLGENLLALIERNKKRGVPRGLVKVIARQMLLGLQYLHEECDLVHTDIKPENIMIAINDVESHITATLSQSPSPACRKVGIPPVKTRGGVSIPRGQTQPRQERHVQIFSSQPLPSPTPSSLSLSAPSSSSFVRSSGLLMSQLISMQPCKAKATAPVLASASTSLHSPTSTNSANSSLKSFSNSEVASTPPTSFESVASPSRLPKKKTSKEEGALYISKKPTATSTSSAQRLAHRHSFAPSLLTQTAPPRSDDGAYSDAESVSSLTHSPPLTPTPPPSLVCPPITIKIADLGNATPSKKHFTEDIQTRQYRSPEAILGRSDWGCTADVWSVACVVFELLTAEYLFDPTSQGEVFSKDDDHMAQIMELVGDFPLRMKTTGKYAREIFDSTGNLRYIKTLKPWPLKRVMKEKYMFSERDAVGLCAFLEPMLVVDPQRRVGAGQMADHVWLDTQDEMEDWECL